MDAGVTVEFNRIFDEDIGSVWRHNGTLDHTDYLEINKNISYTIPQEVQPSDGGVYELQYQYQRGQARAGLMRLIVRGNLNGTFN